MLGKLFKHDLKATSRLFIPMFLGFAALSIINKISLEISISASAGSNFIPYISMIFMTLYIIGIVAVFILTTVFIVMHFYQTMTGEQGYLTHTIPVKTSAIINSNILNAVLWQLLTGVLILLSFALMGMGHIHSSDIKEIIHYADLSCFREMGVTFKQFTFSMSVLFIMGIPSGSLMFYASIALGHLSRKYRAAFSVIAYFAIYFIMQIICMIAVIITGLSTINPSASIDISYLFNSYMTFSYLFTLVSTIIFYLITHYTFSKRLNLE